MEKQGSRKNLGVWG